MSLSLLPDVDVAKQAECVGPEDLLSKPAREVIARVAQTYLQGVRITPIELLHSPAAQSRLMDAGTNAMQAVQKAASWQVRGSKTPVTERVRQIWEIVDAYRSATTEKLVITSPVVLTKDTIADVLAWQGDESGEDRAFRINVCLTKTLETAKTWEQKVALLSDLTMGVAGLDAAGYFDALIAEILHAPKAMAEVLGQEATAGEQVLVLISLADGTMDPNRAPDKPATAATLYQVLARSPSALPEIRTILMGHAVRLIRGNDALTNGKILDEVNFIISIRDRLTGEDGIHGGEETQEALERRLSRALSDQTIDRVMQGTSCVAERVLQAVDLHIRIFGEKPRGYLETYVSELMGQDKVEARLLPEEMKLIDRITLLGRLHKSLRASSFPAKTKERIAVQVERAQAALLAGSKFFQTVAQGKGPVGDRLKLLLDLTAKDMFAPGPNRSAACQTVQAMMKQPDFVTSYLVGIEDKAQQASRLRELEKRLAEAGVV